MIDEASFQSLLKLRTGIAEMDERVETVLENFIKARALGVCRSKVLREILGIYETSIFEVEAAKSALRQTRISKELMNLLCSFVCHADIERLYMIENQKSDILINYLKIS